MTPTNPIIEAREALAKLAHDEYVKSEDRRIVAAALDLAETQAAEIERLKKDHYVRFTDTMNKLELDNAMMAQRLKAGELEYMRSKEAEITTLKAKLAKAEEENARLRSAVEEGIITLDRGKKQSAAMAEMYQALDFHSKRVEASRPFNFAEETVEEARQRWTERCAAQFTKEREGL